MSKFTQAFSKFINPHKFSEISEEKQEKFRRQLANWNEYPDSSVEESPIPNKDTNINPTKTILNLDAEIATAKNYIQNQEFRMMSHDSQLISQDSR